MSWSTRTNAIDYDIVTYGFFCTPCLFGENAYSIKKHPSCLSYALSYNMLILSSQITGAFIGSVSMPYNVYIGSVIGVLLSNAFIGHYAGNIRTQLRDKYDIDGSVCEDFWTHFCCSPCAVCQEAHEIRCRNNVNILDDIDEQEYASLITTVPIAPIMQK